MNKLQRAAILATLLTPALFISNSHASERCNIAYETALAKESMKADGYTRPNKGLAVTNQIAGGVVVGSAVGVALSPYMAFHNPVLGVVYVGIGVWGIVHGTKAKSKATDYDVELSNRITQTCKGN